MSDIVLSASSIYLPLIPTTTLQDWLYYYLHSPEKETEDYISFKKKLEPRTQVCLSQSLLLVIIRTASPNSP